MYYIISHYVLVLYKDKVLRHYTQRMYYAASGRGVSIGHVIHCLLKRPLRSHTHSISTHYSSYSAVLFAVSLVSGSSAYYYKATSSILSLTYSCDVYSSKKETNERFQKVKKRIVLSSYHFCLPFCSLSQTTRRPTSWSEWSTH